MVENSTLKSIGLLIIITVGVFLGTYELAQFFLKEKEHRNFWLKFWLIASVVIGLIFWIILFISGK